MVVDEEGYRKDDPAAEIADRLIEFLGALRRMKLALMDGRQNDANATLGEDGRGAREVHGQIRMLRTLQIHGSMTMQQLANHLDVAPPTVTAMTKRLREQAFIERVRDASDSRVYWITLSTQGEQAISVFHAGRVDSLRRLIAQFDAVDQAEIHRAVEVLSWVLIERVSPLPPASLAACEVETHR